MTMPTITLNGTSAQELYNQAERVKTAARELEAALLAASPHARDYMPDTQPFRNQPFHNVRDEHAARLCGATKSVDWADRVMEAAARRGAR